MFKLNALTSLFAGRILPENNVANTAVQNNSKQGYSAKQLSAAVNQLTERLVQAQTVQQTVKPQSVQNGGSPKVGEAIELDLSKEFPDKTLDQISQ